MEVRVQADGIDEIRRRLGDMEHKAPTVLANAINRAVVNIKKNMAQQTTLRYNITSTEVKKTIRTAKATRTKLEGIVVSRASPIALAKFKVSPNRPVSYQTGRPSPSVYKAAVEKGKATKPLNGRPKSFVAVLKNGHKGVFVRSGSKTRGGHEPIRQNYGPSVSQMIQNEDSMGIVQNEAHSTLRKRIDAEVANILRKGADL